MNTPARLYQLQKVLEKNHLFDLLQLDRIGVFGSFARGQKYHDIDLLLEKDPGYEMRQLLSKVVSNALIKPCDVVVLDKLEPIIKYYILNDIQYVQKT